MAPTGTVSLFHSYFLGKDFTGASLPWSPCPTSNKLYGKKKRYIGAFQLIIPHSNVLPVELRKLLPQLTTDNL